jgi:hypothetical protein
MGLANYVGNRYYFYPFALDFGAPISAAATWQSHSSQMMEYQCYRSSQWCGGVFDKYIGLRFKIGSNIHYGWVRLDVDITTANWKIKDFAYESTPDVTIAAGDNGILGVEESEFNNVRIVAINKSIALYNLFSITGQSVLKGSIESDTYVVEANTVATGVYIMELKDTNTNAVIRKKIVL